MNRFAAAIGLDIDDVLEKRPEVAAPAAMAFRRNKPMQFLVYNYFCFVT